MSAVATLAYSMASRGSRSSPAVEGDVSVSDVEMPAASFLALYADGRSSREHIHDFIETWHESEEDGRSLAEFLGMTDVEFSVWAMDHRMLPLVVAARRGGASLYDRVSAYYDQLRDANRWEDRAAIHSLSYWVPRHRP